VRALAAALCLCAGLAHAQQGRVVDIPTRSGVTQRFLYLAPAKPRAAAVLFSGGAGELQIAADGTITRQKGNFLVRTREIFVRDGVAVALVTAPSDHGPPFFLTDSFRTSPQHVDDIRAVIAWLRREAGVPVWLVGTSRGTLSAAYVAAELPPADGGVDGLVLTSSLLRRGNISDRAVPDVSLRRIGVPVLVVHHRQDGCRVTSFGDVSRLIDALESAPRKELIAVEGGASRGDPCEAFAHHGYNGIEREVVGRIAAWITGEPR
jgi:pimeloyl-ACP methyl ester carboxylesterase